MNNKINRYFEQVEDNTVSLFYSGELKFRSSDAYYDFRVNKNFYYLTNLNHMNLTLMLYKGETKEEVYLFVEESTELIIKWEGKRLDKEEASQLSGIDISNIYYTTEFDNIMKDIAEKTNSIYMCNNDNKDLWLNNKKEEFISKYNKTILNSFDIIKRLRMVKDTKEVEFIIEALKVNKTVFHRMMKNVCDCDYEYEIEANLEYLLKKNNTIRSFETICANGINATVLHYINNSAKLERDDLVLIDFGVEKECYCSDISRVFPVSGKFTDIQKKVYNIVLEANKECIKRIKPGIIMKELNEFAKQIMKDGLVKIGVMKKEESLEKYYYHNIGHHLGLDVHDISDKDLPLEPGNVVTIEPGLYIKDLRIGVRIEDDILVTEDGYINLSEDIIKESNDIEEFMKDIKR